MMYIVEDVKRQIPIHSRLHPTDELHTALKQACVCVCVKEKKKKYKHMYKCGNVCVCVFVPCCSNVYYTLITVPGKFLF